MTVANDSEEPVRQATPAKSTLNDLTLSSCTIGWLPPWGVPYTEDLVRTLLSTKEPFPCTFAVAAARKSSLRFGFVEDLHDTDTWWPMVDVLSDYLKIYQEIARDTSLVIVFPPGNTVLKMTEYYRKFWEILQFLHDNDPEPWPASVPREVEDDWWEFSFSGVPIFAVCSTPGHTRRRSRGGPTFLITFQPRWVFEGLEADTPRGDTARRVIRERLRAYDDIEPSPELGAYGDIGNREWKQYFLPDNEETTLPACPFRHRGQPRG